MAGIFAGRVTAAAAPMTASQELGLPTPRIVNGALTSLYPTTGALLTPGNPASAGLTCSGTLIGCDTFMTAGHCVCNTIGPDCQGANAPNPANFVVFLQHAGFFQVTSVAVNPNFHFPVGDVAILKLATPITGIAPTSIDVARAPAPGDAGTIVGFGRSGGSNFDYGLKRRGAVAIEPCTDGVSNSTSVCWSFTAPVGPPGDDSNTCNGDSGGSLFSDFGCGPTVSGITSGGSSGSCLTTDHSYDANVFFYRAYVQAQGGADLDNTFCGDMPQAGDPNTSILAASGTVSSGTPQATHSFAVPAGTTLLRVAMNAVDDGSDFDLYVKRGSPPTTTDFDCAANGPAQFGFCEFASPAEDIWYVLVNRFAGQGIYQITTTLFASGAPSGGTNGQPCDDQNICTDPDTCQSGACAGSPVVNGTACDDGRACTSPDVCQSGSCTSTAAPLAGCRRTFVAGKAALILKDRFPDVRDSLAWKWLKGRATTVADFGNPITGTDYELCVFDETGDTPSLALHADIPAGPGWSVTSRGFKYKDLDAVHDGVSRLELKDGTDGSASITFRGKGVGLSMSTLPLHQDSAVIVQLLNSNICWEADYSTNTLNESNQFKAKSD